jgi:CHAT domain-containing protein
MRKWLVSTHTTSVKTLKNKPDIGRAEAFRVSMRELIEKGAPDQAHPSQWAPFVVVGEGAH